MDVDTSGLKNDRTSCERRSVGYAYGHSLERDTLGHTHHVALGSKFVYQLRESLIQHHVELRVEALSDFSRFFGSINEGTSASTKLGTDPQLSAASEDS